MKRLLKENWFKIGVLILGASILFVLVFSDSKDDVAIKDKCRDVGQELYNQDLKKEEETRYEFKRVFDPTFGYSKEIDSCIYMGGLHKWRKNSEGSVTSMERWVKDSFTNKTILRFYSVDNTWDDKDTYIRDCEICAESIEDFYKKAQDILSETS